MSRTHQDIDRDIYRDIEFPARVREGAAKPYVFINMVASVDGKTAVEEKASGLGTAVDRDAMRTLRSKADAVMVGGGTVRAEKLALGLDAEDPRPRPLGVILTNAGGETLERALDRNLVRDESQRILVLLAESAPRNAERRLGRLAETRRVPASEHGLIHPASALATLKTEYGIDLLLCEGGPTLNHALISADLADELFVTLAPTIVGEGAPGIVAGTLVKRRVLRLLSMHPAGDEIFLRYALES